MRVACMCREKCDGSRDNVDELTHSLAVRRTRPRAKRTRKELAVVAVN